MVALSLNAPGLASNHCEFNPLDALVSLIPIFTYYSHPYYSLTLYSVHMHWYYRAIMYTRRVQVELMLPRFVEPCVPRDQTC